MAPKPGEEKKPGMMAAIAPVLVATLLIGAGGAFLGMKLARPPEPAARAEEKAPEPDAHGDAGHGDSGHGGGHGADKAHDKPKGEQTTAHKPGKTVLKELAPIVTNLSDSSASWIRIQVAIVYDPAALPHPEVLTTELTADIVAYLRSVALRSIEGANGLRRLHDELSERAATRSEGVVQELIIQSLVVQ